MTVAELIEELRKWPADKDVLIEYSYYHESGELVEYREPVVMFSYVADEDSVVMYGGS